MAGLLMTPQDLPDFTVQGGIMITLGIFLLGAAGAFLAWMFTESLRPITDTDRACDRIDQELDAEAARAREFARTGKLPAASVRIGQDGGMVLTFPREREPRGLTLIMGGLDALGDDADTVFPADPGEAA